MKHRVLVPTKNLSELVKSFCRMATAECIVTRLNGNYLIEITAPDDESEAKLRELFNKYSYKFGI